MRKRIAVRWGSPPDRGGAFVTGLLVPAMSAVRFCLARGAGAARRSRVAGGDLDRLSAPESRPARTVRGRCRRLECAACRKGPGPGAEPRPG
jgi:hypothetical protein